MYLHCVVCRLRCVLAAREMDQSQTILICCVVCTVLITSSSLLGVSFDTVSPTQWGIAYDNNILQLDYSKVTALLLRPLPVHVFLLTAKCD